MWKIAAYDFYSQNSLEREDRYETEETERNSSNTTTHNKALAGFVKLTTMTNRPLSER
jgi:hypothetical protein